jgi:heme A synthase
LPLLIHAPPKSGQLRASSYARYAWALLAYNLLVVMWGAFVRATGSGAGCGNHWPLCNGVVIPRSPQISTIIEFTHRAMSGVALIGIVALLWWGFRAFPKGHSVRMGASLAVFFTVTEALIGAGLVLFEKTAQDKSMARVISLSVHLANTFLLIACIALTAWWASGGRRIRFVGWMRWPLALGLAGALVVGVTGAVTALGDTLYPAASMRDDFAANAPLLLRYRVLHPVLAILVGGYLALLTLWQKPVTRLALSVAGLVSAQWALGALDLALRAPAWVQLIHLLLADLLWIAAVLYTATMLSED